MTIIFWILPHNQGLKGASVDRADRAYARGAKYVEAADQTATNSDIVVSDNCNLKFSCLLQF